MTLSLRRFMAKAAAVRPAPSSLLACPIALPKKWFCCPLIAVRCRCRRNPCTTSSDPSPLPAVLMMNNSNLRASTVLRTLSKRKESFWIARSSANAFFFLGIPASPQQLYIIARSIAEQDLLSNVYMTAANSARLPNARRASRAATDVII